MFPTDLVQYLLFFGALLAITVPAGWYMEKVFSEEGGPLARVLVLGPLAEQLQSSVRLVR